MEMQRQTLLNSFVHKLQNYIENKRLDLCLKELLAEEITLVSPILYKPIQSRAYIEQVLRFITDIVEGFHYPKHDYYNTKEMQIATIFRGRVKVRHGKSTKEYLDVEGIDIFTLDESGKATSLKVMIRPLEALTEVALEMRSRFKRLTGGETTSNSTKF